MYLELKNLYKGFDREPVVEGLLLSDKMAIMEQGHLVQFGQPEEIFRNPATPFVGEFLSLSNLRWDPDGTLVKIIKRG
mgnify:FL=1